MSRWSIDYAYACGQGCSQLLRGKKSKVSPHDRPSIDSICYILIRDRYGNSPDQGFVIYSSWDEIAPLVMEGHQAFSFESSAPLAIWKTWWSQKEVKSFIKGFRYLQLQFSSICGHPGLPVFAALRSGIDAKCVDIDGPAHQDTAASRSVADDVTAIEGLLKTDLSARYLMGSTFPDEYLLFWLSHRQRSQLLLLLKLGLKAYALGKGMNEADSQRVLGLLEKKYNSFDLDAPSELLRQQSRYEQDVPLQERLETERGLLRSTQELLQFH